MTIKMDSPKRLYLNEMYEKFGYFATWEPNKPMRLGDIGTVKDNEFTQLSSLGGRGIGFGVRRDNTLGDLEYVSNAGVSISLKASGDIPPQGSMLAKADAGMIIDFGGKSAVVFKAGKTKTSSIENVDAIGNEILKRYKEGKWDKNTVVITELIAAETASIIISSGGGGKVELKARGKINAASLDIADASAKFQTVYYRDVQTKIIAEKGITPLFKIMGVKSSLIGEPVFRTKSIGVLERSARKEAPSKERVYFGKIDFERV